MRPDVGFSQRIIQQNEIPVSSAGSKNSGDSSDPSYNPSVIVDEDGKEYPSMGGDSSDSEMIDEIKAV